MVIVEVVDEDEVKAEVLTHKILEAEVEDMITASTLKLKFKSQIQIWPPKPPAIAIR